MPKLPISCSTDTTVLESDVADACRTKKLTYIHVIEVPVPLVKKRGSTAGYHVVVKLKGSGAVKYMTTRRDRTTPRLFRHLGRLMNMLREVCPAGDITLHPISARSVKVQTKRS